MDRRAYTLIGKFTCCKGMMISVIIKDRAACVMTIRELKEQLDAFDGNMEVAIGMRQTYGTNFAMEIENNLDEYNITVFGGEDSKTVVITEGSQIGAVDYSDDE